METPELIQGSPEWHAERLGCLTSSKHYRLIGDVKREMTEQELSSRPAKSTAKQIVDDTLLSPGAMTYIEEVVGEILTGQPADDGVDNKATEHGNLYEPVARDMYERIKGVKVEIVGIRTYNPYVKGSPDGLIGTDGGIEIKCPYTNHNHVKNLLIIDAQDLKETRAAYYWQCISGMLINRTEFWDFISYSPNFPMSSCIKIIRLHRDQVEDDIRKLAIKLKYAVIKIEELLSQLKEEEEMPWS